MNSFGKYNVSYTPSDDPCEYLQTAVQMSISSEASLPDMLNFFTDFLRVSGYVFDGELEIVDESLGDTYWKGKYIEMMKLAGDISKDTEVERDFWKSQTYKLLKEENGDAEL